MALRIHPSVGVARLGNSPEQFYLAPEQIGQLPFEADPFGNKGGPVQHFKMLLAVSGVRDSPFSCCKMTALN